jgi:tRNA(fMet)-specific endonuclease VapC
MASVLLDTSVASLFHPKKRASPQRMAYEPDLHGQVLTLSFQSVAELYQWAEQNHWGPAARAMLDDFLSTFVVIPYDPELGRAWARVMTHARTIGRRLETADAWVAATALRHSIPLVTQDVDFTHLKLRGLSVICHTP